MRLHEAACRRRVGGVQAACRRHKGRRRHETAPDRPNAAAGGGAKRCSRRPRAAYSSSVRPNAAAGGPERPKSSPTAPCFLTA
jgi:hypothetical protein